MWFAAALATFVMAIGTNFVLARSLFPGRAVARFALVGSVFGAGLLGGFSIKYTVGIEPIAGFLLYAVCCELYVFLFTLVLSSVSANIVLRLKQGALDDHQLNNIYDSAHMIELRIDRLLRKKLLSSTDEQMQLTKKGKCFVLAFNFFRMLFRHS